MSITIRWLSLCFAVGLWWAGAAPVRGDEPSIPLATGEWPPYTGEALEGGGVAVELVKAVFQEMGRQADIRFLPWRRCEASVRGGAVWAAFPYVRTPERQAGFFFSEPLIEGRDVWFYYGDRMKAVVYGTLADLRPYRIGVASGYWYEELFRQAGLEVDSSSSDLVGLAKLRAGRLDLFPMNEMTGVWLLERYFPDQRQDFHILEQPLGSNQNALLVSKTYPGSLLLLGEFNLALRRIRANGVYQRIVERYRLAAGAPQPLLAELTLDRGVAEDGVAHDIQAAVGVFEELVPRHHHQPLPGLVAQVVSDDDVLEHGAPYQLAGLILGMQDGGRGQCHAGQRLRKLIQGQPGIHLDGQGLSAPGGGEGAFETGGGQPGGQFPQEQYVGQIGVAFRKRGDGAAQ